MTAHVCSTECGCGHWKSYHCCAFIPERGRKRGTFSLDILDDSPAGLGVDYSDYEQEEDDAGQ